MNRAVVVGVGVLVLALAVGCGAGGDETVIKEQIGLMNELAAGYEKVTDAASWKQAQAEAEKLRPRAEELKRKYDAWPEEKKKKLDRQFGPELKTATERLEKARAAARKAAEGKGEAR